MNIFIACNQVRELAREETCVTLAALNSIMSASAERGDTNTILSIWYDFDKYGVQPDADSFSFVFEALGKNLMRYKAKHKVPERHIQACILTAESFLGRMEDRGLEPTEHVIREYVEFLCQIEQIDTATEVVLDIAQQGGALNSKTIYRVSMANAKLRRFDMARKIAECQGDTALPMLTNSIEREELLFRGQNSTSRKDEQDSDEVLSDTSTQSFWRSQQL